MDTKKKAIIVSAILIGLGGYYIYMNMKSKSSTTDAVNGGISVARAIGSA